MIASRLQSWSASSRYWVVRNTVVPSALMRRISSHTVSRLAGSRPVVGSSRKRTCGPVDERRRQVEPALHAARVALDAPVGGVDEVDQLEQLLRPARRPRAVECRTAGPAGSSSSRPVWRGSRPASCRATPMPRRAASGSAVTSTPADPRRARRDGHQRGQHAHGGRLAGAVGPEEAEDLALGHLQVDAAHRVDRPAPAGELLDQLLRFNCECHGATLTTPGRRATSCWRTRSARRPVWTPTRWSGSRRSTLAAESVRAESRAGGSPARRVTLYFPMRPVS